MKKLVFVFIILGLLAGCNKTVKKENSRLEGRLDSMKLALEENAYAVGLLGQVGLYLDSIEAKREWIKFDLETVVDKNNYVLRLKNLDSYLQKADWTVNELENQRYTYISQVKRLKKEIEKNDQAIEDLKLGLTQYKDENFELKGLLDLSEEEKSDTQIELDQTSIELQKSKSEIQNLSAKIETMQAESYYALGEGMEEIARRTQFAPKRKKQSLNDALGFFEQSSNLGYEPAKAKVNALKTRLRKV
jgi:chromosome segregation ATPase